MRERKDDFDLKAFYEKCREIFPDGKFFVSREKDGRMTKFDITAYGDLCLTAVNGELNLWPVVHYSYEGETTFKVWFGGNPTYITEQDEAISAIMLLRKDIDEAYNNHKMRIKQYERSRIIND